MNQEKINFHVARDFSDLFNTSAKFVSQNFKHLFKILILIAGPFVLITSIFAAFYQSHALKWVPGQGTQDVWNYLSHQFGWEYFVFLIFSILSGLVTLTTVYSYLLLYDQYGPKNFDVTEVKTMVWNNITKVLKGFFTLMFIVCAAIAVMSIISGILIATVKIVAAILIILLMLCLLFIAPPFAWQFSTFYLPMLVDNDSSVSHALQKVRKLMRGEFFPTWLLIVAALVFLMILTFVFTVPQIVYQLILRTAFQQGTTTESIPFVIVTSICTFCGKLVYSIFYIICAFHYFSLNEKKEGTALLNRIDEIGNTPSNDVEQQY